MKIKFKNRTSDTARVKIVTKGTNPPVIIPPEPRNTTLFQDGENTFFCLGPRIDISCDGAVENSGCITLDGRFDYAENGVTLYQNVTVEELFDLLQDSNTVTVTECATRVVQLPALLKSNLDTEYDPQPVYVSDSCELVRLKYHDAGSEPTLTYGSTVDINIDGELIDPIVVPDLSGDQVANYSQTYTLNDTGIELIVHGSSNVDPEYVEIVLSFAQIQGHHNQSTSKYVAVAIRDFTTDAFTFTTDSCGSIESNGFIAGHELFFFKISSGELT